MTKLINAIIIISISATLFGSSQSASFVCEYKTGGWGTLGTIYYCDVANAVSILTLDAAEIDDITGTHTAGHSNDNVVAFYIQSKGQIHYFPLNLNRFFKNLKGIYIYNTGLKEIHQSDLQPFPILANLYLFSSRLEVLEANLFEFNPNLDFINLKSNKISHIDANVFDKLHKLTTLHLITNDCINMEAVNNPTEIQNIIKVAKSKCINSDYLNLEQKVKILENESKSLDSQNFNKKFESLENEVKNSQFSNFFQNQRRDLKAVKVEKEKQEELQKMLILIKNATSVVTCSAVESKVDDIAENLKDVLTFMANGTGLTTSDKADSKLIKTVEKIDKNILNLKEVILKSHKGKSTNVMDTTARPGTNPSKFTETMDNFDIKLEIQEENLSNFKMIAYKKFDNIEIEEKHFHASMKKALERSMEEVDRKIGEIEAKIYGKFDEIDEKLEEIGSKFEKKLEEIMKIIGNGE